MRTAIAVETRSPTGPQWTLSIGSFLPSPVIGLGDHLKTGHTLSVQNRPTGLAEDVIVLPRRSVFGQGVV
jgi:hypothetical protein